MCRPSLLINPEGRKIEKENKIEERKKERDGGKERFTYSGIAEIKRRDRLKLDKGLKALYSKKRPVKLRLIL